MFIISWYGNRSGGVTSISCPHEALPSLISKFEETQTQYKISDRCGYVKGETLGFGGLEYQLGKEATFE
jgi:hypothetical protein